MTALLDAIPYAILIPVALWMAIAPIQPEPHLTEKIAMLKAGTLKKPIDIFDLIMHATPLFLLGAKLVRDFLIGK